ncbi:MAG: UDP-glucose 4-epimerase GalE [Bacteroidetes bacterium]|nr:UDP-glucose 4-epimerase GalE [Bacteroidota bacterium]MBS1592013.1 UDP-glucose 4-epimerase GalE [Bacteroidota bacterium]MBS1639059.1 UDP-glucose 4-epimerase GalE [Bacteroidota bacterium]MBS1641863.1 UDP-glucose 4-epimerase GalE [Bacteroidota bacterium]MBS1670692.1 UDP-glucose 4-epimerase GalE [Bacteroidota bacterium]
MNKILVTGGCGFIGSHTIVDLIENGFDVISVDDNSRSSQIALVGIEKITGKKIKNYKVDLKNFEETHAIFQENEDIKGIIHFAAYKAVGESVEQPLMYYENNMFGLINLLKCVKEFAIPYFVFSSSCTVYGSPDEIPVTEKSPTKKAESPYGATKQMGETTIADFSFIEKTNSILLRYFNPVGAHPSCEIGELPLGKPMNLIPVITQTAIGKIDKMFVHGSDYATRDGSCIRDFIHVCDIAHAHTLALQYLLNNKNKTKTDIFNLGTGDGVTVLEAIKMFETVTGIKLNYEIGPRRPGDVVAIYANNNLAVEQLGWKIKYGLKEMMQTAWNWELKLKHEQDLLKQQAALN